LSSSLSPESQAGGSSWATNQLGEFLSALSHYSDELSALQGAIDLAAMALEAEIGAILAGDNVLASIGFARGQVPDAADLIASVATGILEVDGLGACRTVSVSLENGQEILLARSGDDPFTTEESNLLRAMSRSLDLTVRLLRLVADERRHAEENAELIDQLQERQLLLERLGRIQQSISSRAPLKEVLTAIVAGAKELLGDEIVGLRLVDQQDPAYLLLVESIGVDAELLGETERIRLGEGAGGRAITEDALVVVEDYQAADGIIQAFAGDRVLAAMAAPVRENDRAIGSLTIATRRPGRRYTTTEREMLIALANHAGLALIDAKTVAAMEHQAFHDSLTGLPNRALLLDRLDHALRRARRDGSGVALLFVDLDRFKLVNDSLGHSAGDELLAAAAARISGCVRDVDTAARLGGDEFAILLEDTGDNIDAEFVVNRVLESLGAPFEVAGHPIGVGATVGVAISRDGKEDATELLRNADLAMYEAKAAGGRGRAFFEPSMHAAVVHRLSVESDLDRAIANNELVLRYQPIVNLETEEISGVEALVRWQHPTKGLLAPGAFIPLAEETGQIVQIGRWVLHEAIRKAQQWQQDRPPGSPLSVSFNMSPVQLQRPETVGDLRAALRVTGLDPECLIVELTESVLMLDTETTTQKLREFKKMGVRLAIDDFGTGYSALGYLGRFPFDVLKVDQSFVAEIGRSGDASALAGAVIEIARTLHLETVAEGIEDEAQLAALRVMNCKLGQGYYFSKPLTEGDFERLLQHAKRSRRPLPAAWISLSESYRVSPVS
jgi:diguanylate cyclase (GGDEF)-like protein